MTVAALFVDLSGPYPKIPGVECWDKTRDARLYPGPFPVVAHPPCQLWVNFAALNYKRWGGEHNRPGNDQGCFESALKNVRLYGGILEHPAGSKAWDAYGLVKPLEVGRWVQHSSREWSCEVWQSAYGHKARKRTWLWYVGGVPPWPVRREQNPGTHQIGGFDKKKPVLSKREALLTPPEFAMFLVSCAKLSKEVV